ncbi:MAG TPA: YbaK/EbsC family protein [Anaerohalosphaeraceae bacterium]|jgi:Ala-tRNA(Pro) deacylase|nr:YbaK/EbsC family protein [Anaerohalosphaeraceae bacterium]HRT50099.1 YbaK/EbsC family protein [Anaerohalosphaeraceae bacterium]HRT86033.1 YbaK/EbsC family protein [Anaerohalosphaeraceae bacterium]
MRIVEFLKKFDADYTIEEGRPLLGAREIGAHRYFGGVDIARTTVVRADEKRYMCVAPLDYTIDMNMLRQALGAVRIERVDENEMRRIFPSCQSGAEPPFGALYGLPTLMDASMEADQYIAFQGETYDRAIIMTMAEYKRLASPRIFSFAYPAMAGVYGDLR